MYSNSYLYFIAARIIGLAHKPLILYYFIYQEMLSSAAVISMVYLSLSSLLVLFSIPFHMEFYKVFFSSGGSFLKARGLIKNYIASVFMQIMVVTPLVLILLILSVDELYLALLITLLLLVEKFYDEIQRFLLFSKNFIDWSNLFLIKTLVPVGLSVVTNYYFSVDLVVFYIIYSIVTGSIVVITTTPKFIKIITVSMLSNFKMKLPKYLLRLRERYFSRYIISICSRNILNLDKWLVNFMGNAGLFAELTFLSQLGNVITTGGNYMYVSNRRSDLLNASNNLSSLWIMGKVLIYTFILFLGLYLTLHVMIYVGLVAIDYFSALLLFTLFMSYAIYAVTEPISEYLFWNKNAKLIIGTELVFYIFMVLGGYFIYNKNGVIYMPVILLIGITLRLLMHIKLISSETTV